MRPGEATSFAQGHLASSRQNKKNQKTGFLTTQFWLLLSPRTNTRANITENRNWAFEKCSIFPFFSKQKVGLLWQLFRQFQVSVA